MRKAPFLLLVFAGCVNIPLPHRAGEPAPSLERKQVAGKREPNELVAIDGTSCATTDTRFARAQRGDRVWCVWRDVRGNAFTGR